MKEPSCISAEELILYREGKLAGKRLGVVRRHVDRCLLCLDALLYVVDDTGDDSPVEVPADFMENLNRIARQAREETSVKKLAVGGKAS